MNPEGKMKFVALLKPCWFVGNDTHTKRNPDVVQGDFLCEAEGDSYVTRLVRLRVFGKSPINAYLRLNRRLWNNLPASVTALGPVRSYGCFLHKLVRIQSHRGQLATRFFFAIGLRSS
jgi:hypothetical protein